ncbi:MAG: hypothetical protein JNL98_12560 [Bryobacterales bacterium]|nr:hypothetical protein [Bryobacterales bacterium]
MTRRSVLLRVLLPDAAMVVAVFALFYGVLAGDGPQRFFRDSDTGWHIRTGESILDRGSLPRSDPYSFTMSGKPWFAWEWGSDVLMGVAHRLDGLSGVALLYAAAVACATWLWFQLHWVSGGNFFLACAMASPMLTTLQLHWLARPHVLSWVYCVAAAVLFERACARAENDGGIVFRWWHGALAVLAGILWANTHASFFLLPALALMYAAGRLANGWLWSANNLGSQWLAAVAVYGMAGSFVNPYGAGLHTHVAAYLVNRELLSRIGEYQTFNFHGEGTGQILLVVLLSLVGAAAAFATRRADHFLIVLVFTALALRSARVLPVLALLGLPLANRALTAALRDADLRPRLRHWLDTILNYSGRVRAIDASCGGWAVAPLALFLAFVILHAPANAARAGFPPSEFPVQAAVELENLPEEAKLLAPDKFGGYLIYRFAGRRKVFFDGRSDFYGVEFMKNYIRLIEARPGWKEQVTQFGFTHALLPNRYTLVQGLRDWGWRQRYRDDVVTLLEKD